MAGTLLSSSSWSMAEITARQRQIVDFIRRRLQEQGYPPTVREIGQAVGLTSSSSVHAQLANLERLGVLRRHASRPRALELRDAGGRRATGLTLPVLGRIAAGAPLLADQNIEDYLVVPAWFADAEDHFALRIRGDSMTGAGILDGDLAVVRRQESARDGDIVAALLPGVAEDEATVKRLRRSGGGLLLVPENPAMEPIQLGDGRVLGKVVALLRRF